MLIKKTDIGRRSSDLDILKKIRDLREKSERTGVPFLSVLNDAIRDIESGGANRPTIVKAGIVRVKRPCGSKLSRMFCPQCKSELLWARVNDSLATMVGGGYNSHLFCQACEWEEFCEESELDKVKANRR
jgi:hypothetical protein